MKRAIVVCANNRDYFNNLIKSIDTKYDIYSSWNGIDRPEKSYELGAIKKASEIFDEFIFLQDSTEIKDNTLFDKLFETEGNVALTNGFYHYMGKYVSKDLPEIPECHNKEDAIYYEIRWFTKPYKVFKEELPVHTNNFEEKFGESRMILENKYIKKWKGTYRL